MCPSEATCLSADCCFSEIANSSQRVRLVQSTAKTGRNILLCKKFCIENGNISHNLIQLKGEVIYFCVESSAFSHNLVQLKRGGG
jgi:hypothetical protein